VSRKKYEYQETKSYVAQVSIRGINLGTKFFIEGQSPEPVVLGLPGDA
jgi:hypothetical protein